MNDSVSAALKPKFDFTADTLPEHPLFHGLALKHRQILAASAMRAQFEPGESVFTLGEPASCFYLVTSGSIALETQGSRFPAQVQMIEAGGILGWSWLFPPYYWHFNALAQEHTEAIFFYGSRLRQQSDQDHDFGYELLKRMSQILVGRLQADRARWIEAAHIAPLRIGIPTDYLVI